MKFPSEVPRRLPDDDNGRETHPPEATGDSVPCFGAALPFLPPYISHKF